MDVLNYIKNKKIIAISRKVYGDDLLKCVRSLVSCNINVLEITFDQSSKTALIDTPSSIAMLKEEFKDDICIGAGTVMTKEQVLAAKKAGADFALSPNTDIDVIKCMKENNLISIPGALTPSEIVNAYNAGADIVKLFPADAFSLDYIKAITAPISHIPLMAVGGVSLNNVNAFLDAGYIGVGVGSNIISAKKVAQNDFDGIYQSAKEFAIKVGVYNE